MRPNYRIERHERDQVPLRSMGGCGAHAERLNARHDGV